MVDSHSLENVMSNSPTPIESNRECTPENCATQSQPNDGDDQLETAREPELKSVVWNHFTRRMVLDIRKSKEVLKAVCNYCNTLLCGDLKNGTSHLHGHVKRCPHRPNPRGLRQNVLTKNWIKGDGQDLTTHVYDENVFRKELGKMVIMHEYPVSMVEHIGFRRYSKSLRPVFKVPYKNTIKSDILKIYYYEREKTRKLVERNESRLAITSDMWTSSNQKKGFMIVTAHFIDSAWSLQSRLLRFIYVPFPHTSETLRDYLCDCLMNWNVDTKLSTITLDNCSTNDLMVNILFDRLDSTTMLINGRLLQMRCSTHIFNVIVKFGLEVIKESIQNVGDSVAYWSLTPKRKEFFNETAKQLRIPITKSLDLDVTTRSNSTFLMLQTALKYKVIFARLRVLDSQYKTCPSEEEWKFASGICDKLKLFYDATELLSGTKYPTANLQFPKICEIKVALISWLVDSDSSIRQMAANMIENFDKYWSDIHELMGVAAILDPRYKMDLLEFYFEKIYGEEFEVHIERIRCVLYDLIKDYKLRMNVNGESVESDQADSQTSDNSLNDFDLFVRSKKRARTSYVRSELERYLEEEFLPVERYLEEGFLPRTSQFDILLWWRQNGVKYPILQKIARDILPIPVSAVASESAFITVAD